MKLKKLWEQISKNYWFPVLIYAIFGILWIKLSDTVLLYLVSDSQVLIRIQTWKGWFFILVTSLLLLTLVRRHHQLLVNRIKQQKKLMMNLSVPVILVDPDGQVIALNAAFTQTLGYKLKDIPDLEHWTRQAYPDLQYRKQVLQQWKEDTKNMNSLQATFKETREFRVTDKWGEEHSIEFLLFPQDSKILLLCRDITAKIKEEQKHRQEEKMRALGQLAGGIAHDFNNHLSAIMGYTDLLADRLKEQEDQEFLQHIIEAAKTSAELTSQLLTYSRKTKTELVPVNMETLLDEVISLGRHTFPSKIEIHIEKSNSLSPIKGNPGMLKSMILNLLINARDAMPSGGKILIRYKEEIKESQIIHDLEIQKGNFLLLKICDQGIGMNKRQQSRIFEPFYTTKTKKMGSGMGLAMVYSTLKVHNGAIEIESESGKGSCFTIFLPVIKESN